MTGRLTWLASLLALLAASLAGCGPQEATIDEIVGTYRGPVPYGNATLVMKADGIWEYHFEPKGIAAREGRSPEIRRSGKWRYEPTKGFGSYYLHDFELGFSDEELDSPNRWGSFGPSFERYADAVMMCFDADGQLCLKKVRQALPDTK